MANYATLDDVKEKLQQETTSVFDDTVINATLIATTAFINNIVGDLHLMQKTEQIELCDFNCRNEISLCTSNITSLDEINGTVYNGVLGTDYQICDPRKRKLIICDLLEFIKDLEFKCFDIKYTAGYTDQELRDFGLSYLQACLVVDEITKKGNQIIESEKLGPKTIKFKSEESKTIAENLLGNFISFIV